MRKSILIPCFLLFALATIGEVKAQRTVMDEEPFDYSKESGPGEGVFSYSYFRYGLPFGVDHGADPRVGRSFVLSSGASLNAPLFKRVALNLGYGFTLNEYVSFSPYRDFSSHIADINRIERYKVNTVDVDADITVRFTLNKPGNSFGLFLDLGVTGLYRITAKDKLYYTDFADDQHKFVTGKLDDIERWAWGYTARLGFNKWTLMGHYRASGLMDQAVYAYDLPEWMVGVELLIWE